MKFNENRSKDSGDMEWTRIEVYVWCLTTRQPLWVISVRRYQTKHDLDGKSKKL